MDFEETPKLDNATMLITFIIVVILLNALQALSSTVILFLVDYSALEKVAGIEGYSRRMVNTHILNILRSVVIAGWGLLIILKDIS